MMRLSLDWMFLLFPLSYRMRRANGLESVFTTVLVVSTFGHWTLPCYFTLNVLKQHPIRPFLPGG